MYSSVCTHFDKCLYQYNHNPNQFMEHFYHNKRFLMPFCSQYLFHLIPGPTQPLISLMSLKFRLTYFRILYIWNHTVCTILCLAFFIQHNILIYIQAVVDLSSLSIFTELCDYITVCLSFHLLLMDISVVSS